MARPEYIEIRGARQHNLKGIDLRIPRGQLVAFTGVSGSGKSSLAFDTIYAEGQRRYVESLSSYARQFFDRLPKPDVDQIEGLPPTVAVEQRAGLVSPRATVATTTEIHDFVRLLFARVGLPHCHQCGRPLAAQTVDEIVEQIVSHPVGTRLMVLAPLVRAEKGGHEDVLDRIRREGFVRVRIDRDIVELADDTTLDARKPHHVEAVVDRLVIGKDIRARVSDSVELALRLSGGMVMVLHEHEGQWIETLCTERYACPECKVGLEELSPRIFSFNSPHGACPKCMGLGTVMEFDPDLLVPDPQRPLGEALEPAGRAESSFGAHYQHMVEEFASLCAADIDEPFDSLPDEQKQVLLQGTDARQRKRYRHAFEGIVPSMTRRLDAADSDAEQDRVQAYMSELPCGACQGARLRPESLAVKVAEHNIHDVARLSVDAALGFFRHLTLPEESAQIAERVVSETSQRLQFLSDVGLGYLTLDRRSSTLSGGELQRIRLATQVGTGLVGMCYVLDEPTIGLHPCDNRNLLDTLAKLRDAGSTVIVVEHDEETIRSADYVVELGPGPGDEGGHLVAEGATEEFLASDSLTAQFLSGARAIPIPAKRRTAQPAYALTVKGARANNLANIDVAIPLGLFVCVTGVSGSGKSTLVLDVLRRALMKQLYGSRPKPGEHDELLGSEFIEKLVVVDQTPIGRSPRSNAATYTRVFAGLRQLFSMTREAKVRGYGPTRFSFNTKGGRCEACEGQGTKKIDMQFLPDIFVTCEVCKGARYNRETLEVRYRGRNIAEILDMKVSEASEFFKNVPRLKNALGTLSDVGLGYVQLGQSSTALSGGEAQRVKLAAELSRRSKGRSLYILDEPTTGLHFADIGRLLEVLNRLVDMGNTVLVIEHNIDVIAAADHLIDLGPGAGHAGGRVVATGTPEEVAATDGSKTGECLKDKLKRARGKETTT